VRTGIVQTLKAALEILRADAPAAFFRMQDELDGLAVRVDVEGECFGCRCSNTGIAFGPPPRVAQADVRSDRHTILALIDGRSSYLEAVLARDLAVQGPSELLARISRAGLAFSEGALRARRMRPLLDDFRAGTARRTRGAGSRRS
jgi:hypothetical protein